MEIVLYIYSLDKKMQIILNKLPRSECLSIRRRSFWFSRSTKKKGIINFQVASKFNVKELKYYSLQHELTILLLMLASSSFHAR